MHFSYEIDEYESYSLVKMSGSLMDKNTALPLLSAIHEQSKEGKSYFILDLSALEYMNSSGINVLINILTRARNQGGDVVITGLTPKIKSLLVITKLNSVFKVAEDMEEAEQKIRE